MRQLTYRLLMISMVLLGGALMTNVGAQGSTPDQLAASSPKNYLETVDPLDADVFPTTDVYVAQDKKMTKAEEKEIIKMIKGRSGSEDQQLAAVVEAPPILDTKASAPAETPIMETPDQPTTQLAQASSLKPGNPSSSDIERFEGELRKQKVSDITDRMSIEQKFKDAKKIPVPPSPIKEVVKDEKPPSVTDTEIIQSLVPAEFKTTKIDLEFDSVRLNDIFMTLGKAANINVMLDPAMKDLQMDLHLKQVPIEESFILIANAYNLGFKKVGNSVFVTDREKLRQQNFITKVLKLRNISAPEAKTMLNSMIKTINVGEEINALIVVGDEKEIAEVEKVLKIIDVPQPQVVLEANVIELNRDALKDLGVDWSDSITMNYQESGRPVDLADPEDAGRNFGSIAKFQRNALQFSTTIKMLENQNKAKILSNPKVTTLNNKEAEIFVGDRIPYTVTTVSGGVATTDVRFEEPGIRLKITPSIIEDDFVVIKVEPEVSFIFSFRGPDDQYPWVKKRQATAYVRVKNGQPFVLGGLLNQEDKKNFYKVPMLGDIPLLGNLFSYERNTVLDTELIITVTPTIVRGDF